MPSYLSPSIQVVEVRQGVTDVTGVSTSTGGFSGVCQKGPINSPQYITSITQFQQVFGQPIANSYMFEQVDAFFKNGGAACWVNRVANYGNVNDITTLSAIKASKNLQTPTGGATAGTVTGNVAAPFGLAAGDTLQVATDGGATLTATINATAASVTGTGATYASLNTKTLLLSINGAPQTITFDATAVDAPSTVALLNNLLSMAHAEVATGQVKLVTDRRGNTASLVITGGTALAALGLSTGSAAGTGNVADNFRVTHADLFTIFAAAFPGAVYSPASGSAGFGTLTSATQGANSSVNIVGGTAAPKLGFATGLYAGSATASPVNTVGVLASSEGGWGNNLSVNVVPTNTVVSSLLAALPAGSVNQAVIKSTTQLRIGDFIRLSDGTRTLRVQIIGINGNTVSFAPTTLAAGINLANSTVARERFTIQALVGGQLLAAFNDLAISPLQAIDYFVTRVNNTLGTPILVTDLGASAIADARPAAVSNASLAGGSDGSPVTDNDYIGSAATRTGLYAFDPVSSVDMLSVPGVTTVLVHRGLLDYCTARQDLFAILAAPAGLNASQVQAYVTATANLVSSYGAIYWPWVKMVSPLTGQVEIASNEGFAQGRYANTDRTRNVAKAPAGSVDGRLVGVVGLEQNIGKADYDLVYPSNVNGILNVSGQGICLFGSRTLESSEFNQISVRRTFQFVEQSLAEAFQFALFENNDEDLWQSLTRVASGFLRNLRVSKMLQGKTDAEAFFVICDARNNTPAQIQTGVVLFRVGIATKRPGEFLQLEIQQNTAAVDAQLAA